jgi:uncharacterized phage-associated protein
MASLTLTGADVAKYILDKKGVMSAMKLHKLVYYSQAWSLVWDDEPLFNDAIEAWANGPVVRSLYNIHKGMYQVSVTTYANYANNELSENQKDTIDTVLEAYSGKSTQWLSDQTHSEQPWIIARRDLADNERFDPVITLESMVEYYSAM